MLTIFILFTTLATNRYGMCEGASKQTPDLKILPHRDRPAPSRFEIPGSATGTDSFATKKWAHKTYSPSHHYMYKPPQKI